MFIHHSNEKYLPNYTDRVNNAHEGTLSGLDVTREQIPR